MCIRDRTQNPGEQTMVKSRDRLTVVKMNAEQPFVHSNTKAAVDVPAAGEETKP